MSDLTGYVFTRGEGGKIELKADFEALYQADPDPWGQSANNPARMNNYYPVARRNLVQALRDLPPWQYALDVGCGLGYVTNLLSTVFRSHAVEGLDISPTAIEKAKALFPAVQFIVGDVSKLAWDAPRWKHYDVVILNQVLWYIMADMPRVLHNVLAVMKPHGHLVIQTAHLDQQDYGREIMDGFTGLVKYMLREEDFQLVYAKYEASSLYAPYHDGLLVMRRT